MRSIIKQENKLFLFCITLVFLLCSNSKAQSQNVDIDPDFKTDSTYINFTTFRPEKKVGPKKDTYSGNYSLDNKNLDSLVVSIGAVGTTSYWIKIKIGKNKIEPSFLVVTDYDAYDGKNYYELPINNYKLLINAVNLKKGDNLYLRISGETNNFYEDKITFDAEVHHIVGKKMRNNRVRREISDKKK
jgi:hypothetical protein